jgi:hypothetical protein
LDEVLDEGLLCRIVKGVSDKLINDRGRDARHFDSKLVAHAASQTGGFSLCPCFEIGNLRCQTLTAF